MLKIGFAQINTTVGDLAGNAALIIGAYQQLVKEGAELVITPELSLTGYPPRDLLFMADFVDRNLAMLSEIEKKISTVPLIVGFVDHNRSGLGKPFYNAAAFLIKGKSKIITYKRLLPNNDVFDEPRYFEPGATSKIIPINGCNIGLTICEDLWTPEYLNRTFYTDNPPKDLVDAGADLIVNISASPFHCKKSAYRLAMVRSQAERLKVPIAYCNSVGGNDQLIFDGHSLAVSSGGRSWIELAACREENRIVDFSCEVFSSSPPIDELEELYNVLIIGLRDYCFKCGFKKVVIGLSGGIDSALVAALAVAALGSAAVRGVLLPGPYSSKGSIDDALVLAKNLDIETVTLPITPLYEKTIDSLKTVFSGYQQDATEENIQARLRGITLMALSNKFGSLLLTTGNKSEIAVGYCTLYGDMCGGLAVISDLLKTKIYELSRWINREKEIIPLSSIEKAPSAELRSDQKDQDTLPPYDILDPILQLYLEENKSLLEIVAQGFDEDTVRWIIGLVIRSEYKRQQAAPGLKVTEKAFGVGRRCPIAQKYSV